MFLAIDFGLKRIGLAAGQALPFGLGVIDAGQKESAIFDRIKQLCRQYEVEAIVIGLPLRSRSERGTLADRIEVFGQKLGEVVGLPIHYEEEQFTSTEAEMILKDSKYDRKSGKVDELAAILILEQFLAHKSRNT